MKYICKSFLFADLLQADHMATDIRIYNVVQTGPKTQAGGLKLGKIIPEYHGSLYSDVIKPPIPDATKVIDNINSKDKYLFFVMI